jgi:NAD-dependent SIR2 family protein deacetylase
MEAPGAAHRAFTAWESAGTLLQLVTQNVDGLHQRAGSRAVIDLHGRLDVVVCLSCSVRTDRSALQASSPPTIRSGWRKPYPLRTAMPTSPTR